MVKTTIHWMNMHSPFGPLLMAVSGKGLRRLAFGESGEHLASLYPQEEWINGGKWASNMAPLISAIVSGDVLISAKEYLPVQLDMQGTEFQKQVWNYLLTIPAGETRRYADISRALGTPGADRAVGSANGANPIAIVVPCHRVIRSDGGLGGYAYGVPMKQALLKREGALQPDLFG
jgi:AraC family transcriptional regulator of adaptative response/methylated-DNA-[protein]-cysteine methyltransferase